MSRSNRSNNAEAGTDGKSKPADGGSSKRKNVKSDSKRRADAKAAKSQEDEGSTEEDDVREYSVEQAARLFFPVCICMALVICGLYALQFFETTDRNAAPAAYLPYKTESEDNWSAMWQAALNALAILGILIVFTIVIVVFFYFQLYRVLHVIMGIVVTMLLFTSALHFVSNVARTWNFPLETVSFIFSLVNYTAGGVICLFWKGPLLLQQFYLVVMSMQVAIVFLQFLPAWTVWVVLVLLAVWDLIAVLTPFGPLNILINLSKKRKQPVMTALIYSSGIALLSAVDEDKADVKKGDEMEEPIKNAVQAEGQPKPACASKNSSGTKEKTKHEKTSKKGDSAERSNEDEAPKPAARSMGLGIGDFVFYAVLVGKAATFRDLSATIACFTCVLVGLCTTTALLMIFRMALPALPISVFLGVIFCFATQYIIRPFCDSTALRQIVV